MSWFWVSVYLRNRETSPPGGDLLGLTSSGSQVAVKGNVSLAHGQEICTDIWKDRRASHKVPVVTLLSLCFCLERAGTNSTAAETCKIETKVSPVCFILK